MFGGYARKSPGKNDLPLIVGALLLRRGRLALKRSRTAAAALLLAAGAKTTPGALEREKCEVDLVNGTQRVLFLAVGIRSSVPHARLVATSAPRQRR